MSSAARTRRTSAAVVAPVGPERVTGGRKPQIPATEPHACQNCPHNRWALWFQAKPVISVELRGRTKTGKPRRHPVRYPPNINERRAMHWTVEKQAVEYWRIYARREAERQAAMRLLERVRISATVYRRAIGTADGPGDAERLKPLVDGLVDAGVIPDDLRRYVEYGPVDERRTRDHHRGDGILLIVEALDPPAGTGGPGLEG